MGKIKPLNALDLKTAFEQYSHFLSELKKRLITTFILFAVATFGGFFFYEQIVKFLIQIFSLKGVNVVFTSPFQFINLAISCGVVSGLIVALPLLVWQIISFLKPALKLKEYQVLIRFLPFSFILFLIGFAFGALIMKWQIEIFLDRSVAIGIGNILDISHLLSTVLLTSALMGLGFQFPIVLLLLLSLGVVNRNQLTSKRAWIYLGSFIFALLLPPDSILADILLSLPLVFLFELTLVLDRVFESHKRN